MALTIPSQRLRYGSQSNLSAAIVDLVAVLQKDVHPAHGLDAAFMGMQGEAERGRLRLDSAQRLPRRVAVGAEYVAIVHVPPG